MPEEILVKGFKKSVEGMQAGNLAHASCGLVYVYASWMYSSQVYVGLVCLPLLMGGQCHALVW